jgi:hypothetical protein
VRASNQTTKYANSGLDTLMGVKFPLTYQSLGETAIASDRSRQDDEIDERHYYCHGLTVEVP